jgi:protein-S-isoprenylcysteine O-methyltransferase Ste14
MRYDILAFTIGSGFILWWSRKSLRYPGTHGFYRFFAWEAILLLFALNDAPWGQNIFSAHQIIATVLMLLSILLVQQGIVALRRHGKACEQREAPGFYTFEKTTSLVRSGVFAYIRHPMYASLLALAWGAYFQRPSQLGSGVALLGSIFLVLTAKADEKECLQYFGKQYAEYKQQTWMFIPYVL